MFKVKQTTRRGFSLIELAIVVMILAILAGIVVPLIGGLNQISTPGGTKSDKQIITETSMLAIRDAILGTSGGPGAWSDLGRQPAQFPTSPSLLTVHQNPFVTGEAGEFNPVTKIGWRGPYLMGASRQDDGSNVFLDGWGNPLTIFVPDTDADAVMDGNDITYARLVSNGPNGILETAQENTTKYDPSGSEGSAPLTLDDCGDDLLLFFFVADKRQ